MSADMQNGRAALCEDLELTPDAAALVKGGMFFVGPGEEDPWSQGRLEKKKRKKKVAKRHYSGGGRPV
jgi:hypothetical protein